MHTVLNNIKQYQDEYLIIDGTIPIVTNSTLSDEMTLYSLEENIEDLLLYEFERIINKKIFRNTDLNILSYGQKVIFSVLCSIFCCANKVMLRRVESSIDVSKFSIIKLLIEKELLKGRIFYIIND